MKRMLLTTTTMSAILALAAPGIASAHSHAESHHHARHASAHHHRHHVARVTVRHFGSPLPAGSDSGSTTTTTPPVTPPSTSGETAGTVTSFTGGVLTITLTNGSTVTGEVTEQTEIGCLSSTTPPTEGEDQGDDRGGSESGDRGRGDDRSSGDGRGDQGDGGDDDGGPTSGQNDQTCTTAALVAGAVVREAELRVSSSGAVWDHVDLIG